MDETDDRILKTLDRLIKRAFHEANYCREIGRRDTAIEHEREARDLRLCQASINANKTLRLANKQRREARGTATERPE